MPADPHLHPVGPFGTRPLGRRLVLGALAVIMGLGVAFGQMVATPHEAEARRVDRLSSGCSHRGQYYASGQVIEMSGVPYVCQDGRWVLSPFLTAP